ncbi:MAG: gluconate 2-dehydrogenase subunit 3 family protein [Opitutales bacterium]|nr:gluconate 2-dehydrogenase subunit 3 family protein [Opitutales bacterium]
MNEHISHKRMDRRSALKWMFAATATVHFLDTKALGQSQEAIGLGYGTDPDLIKGEVPWERTMTEAQLRTTKKLADIILPKDGAKSPSASEVGVPDFFDEWISAPYENHQKDRTIILDGLAWIDRESQRRFGTDFHLLARPEFTEICDDIAYLPDALPEYEFGAQFFSKFRSLTMGGYYTTDIGAKDLGYDGNYAMQTFDGPPPEVLKQLGIDKAPW